MTQDLELLYSLTETDIAPWFTLSVLAKARRLYNAGRVSDLARLDASLYAEVQDDDGLIYQVEVSLEDGWVQGICDCESDDYCAHVAALLINWLHAPGDFVQELAADLPDDEVIALSAPEPAFDEASSIRQRGEALAAQFEQTIKQDLTDLLREQTVQQLRTIARRRGWPLRGTRKDDLIDQLVQFCLEGQDTAQIVEALDADRRLALELLALRTSMMAAPENVVNKAIRGLKGRRSAQETNAILQEFQELGLLFARKVYAATAYRMPSAVVRQLPTWPGLLPAFKGEPGQLDVHQSAGSSLIQVVYQLWQYLREPPLPKKARSLPPKSRLEQSWPNLYGWLNPADEIAELEKLGYRFWYSGQQYNIGVRPLPSALSGADLAALRQRTGASDDISDFCFTLLTALEFVDWEYGADIQINEKGLTTFLSYSESGRLQILTSAWLTLEWGTEMALVLRHAKHLRLRRRLQTERFTYNDLTRELAHARLVVIMLLRRLTPGVWYSVADLSELLRRFWPNYLHAGSAATPQRWWLEIDNSDTPLSPEKAEDWQVGHAPFMTACLEGPLAWLGAVTLGYNRQGLAAFQLTDLGTFLLGVSPAYDELLERPVGPALTIHGDGTVLARTGYAAAGAYDLLNVLGRLEETSVERFSYRITPATAQRAFERGWTGQAILDELEKQSAQPVPEPLRSHFLTWAEGYGKVHLYHQVTLIEFADDFALKELLASTSLAQHLIYQFSPRLAVIKTEAVDALRDELVRQGHTPRIE